MKALILVGGFGTRLRPLTLTCPKPLVEFANKPMIIHQIEALKEAGCIEVVLAINYQPEVMAEFVKKWAEKIGIKITISKEDEPMGTAGPLALAKHILDDGSGEPFFVFNSDVTCDYPLAAMVDFHKKSGAEGTILVTKVKDPSSFGVVIANEQGQIQRFVEKPKDFVGDEINAGIYILSPAALKRIQPKPTSIERETFPAIAADGKLYSFLLKGYWMDVGKPFDFLKGQALHLTALAESKPQNLATGPQYIGAVIVDSSATIGPDCSIGPNVSIGEGVEIGARCRLRDCVLMRGVKVGNSSLVSGSILGWGSKVGDWSRLEGCVLGQDCAAKDEVMLKDAIVLPQKEIKESIYSHQIIL